MQIARVRGSVVSTNKTEKLHGLKLLVVVPIELNSFEEKGSPSSPSIPLARGRERS